MTSAAFSDWKAKAQQADILQEAISRGAKLKRVGREHVGPCPICGGADRFSINPQKRIFNCRGAEGGDVIGLVMHLDGCSFAEACEVLTGEPPPNGKSAPLSPAERVEREKRQAENQAAQRRREAEQAKYEEDTREAAQAIWDASVPIPGTIAQVYFESRGILAHAGRPSLRFHHALPYPGLGKLPAVICRVDDVVGDLTAVWRIYLTADGRKASVEHVKLGLGPAGGGAVRLGGVYHHIGVAEGVETAIAASLLVGETIPVWATLSTAGMVGFEVPLGVSRVTIFPDGDRAIKRQGKEYVPAIPAGRKAAQSLFARLTEEGVRCAIAAEPPAGTDYLDMYNASLRETA